MESILPFNFNNPHYRKFNFCRHVHGMTIALRRQLQQHAFPTVSFGPFRFFEAMPWLVLAASMRVIAFNNPLIAIPATLLASVAILRAAAAVGDAAGPDLWAEAVLSSCRLERTLEIGGQA